LVGCRLSLVSAHSRAVEQRPRSLHRRHSRLLCAGRPFRERRVLGQQGEDSVDLALLEGIGEALHKVSHPRVAGRPKRRLPARLRQPLLDRAAGAEQRPVDRRDRGLERVRRLLGGELEYVPEDEHSPLAGGKVLQRGDEGELERLSPFVASLGRSVTVRAAGGLLRVRLDRQRPVERALAAVGDRVEANVGRDPIQPTPRRASAAEVGLRSPGPQEGVLERILCIVQRAEHPVAVRVKRGAMRLDEAAEGVLVASAHDFVTTGIRPGPT
jgi:hypothetical protein